VQHITHMRRLKGSMRVRPYLGYQIRATKNCKRLLAIRLLRGTARLAAFRSQLTICQTCNGFKSSLVRSNACRMGQCISAINAVQTLTTPQNGTQSVAHTRNDYELVGRHMNQPPQEEAVALLLELPVAAAQPLAELCGCCHHR
jgi:hypothetical protein